MIVFPRRRTFMCRKSPLNINRLPYIASFGFLILNFVNPTNNFLHNYRSTTELTPHMVGRDASHAHFSADSSCAYQDSTTDAPINSLKRYPHGILDLCTALSWLAEVVGFEPTNDGIKSRCLTTWLYPYIADRGRVWDRQIILKNS